ncbi:amidase [Tardiphaga sp.]|jgi:amidase|uniref:amidase n=1 Tax=Tardiphaga sp. TaxID=1926292 RepID=UPI0037D9FDC9
MTDCLATASEQIHLLKTGQTRSRDLLEEHVARIEKYNPALNAIIYLSLAEARKRADEADAARSAGIDWGPLHGLPMTVKDVHHIAGWPTTYGDPSQADWVPNKTATLIDRLSRAGAIIFGKTNIPLHSADFQTFNALFGSTRNPWDLSRSPGGSSGGAASALAAGLTPLEVGTDIAGSIRFPAHFCGVYGHKPTHGIISHEGNLRVGSNVPTDLSTAGPMARSADDLELLLRILVGPAYEDEAAWTFRLPKPRKTRLADFRIGTFLNSSIAPIDEAYSEVIKAFLNLLINEGASPSENSPVFDHAEAHDAYIRLLRGTGSARLSDIEFKEVLSQSAALDEADRSYAAQLKRAQAQNHRSYVRAEEVRAEVKVAWARFFEDHDVLLAPVTLSAAYRLDESTPREIRQIPVSGTMVNYNDQLFWSGYNTLPSLPVTTIPIGFVSGLPVGLNIVGPHLGDTTTLAFAKECARLHGFVAPPGYES